MQNNLELEFRQCPTDRIPELVRLCQDEWRHGERPLLPPDVVAEAETDRYVNSDYGSPVTTLVLGKPLAES